MSAGEEEWEAGESNAQEDEKFGKQRDVIERSVATTILCGAECDTSRYQCSAGLSQTSSRKNDVVGVLQTLRKRRAQTTPHSHRPLW